MHVLLFAKDLAFLGRLIVNFLFLYFIVCNIVKYMCKLIRELSCKGGEVQCCPGLHKLWYPSIRDTRTWSKFGAHGEHGDVFLFSNLGAL